MAERPRDPGLDREAPQRERRVPLGRRYRSHLVSAQQYIFLGLALLLLAGWLLFRDSCADRLGETFGVPTPKGRRDGSVDGSPRAHPPPSDPDDW